MTKQQELNVLDAAIAQLPEYETYLGPWLRQVRHEVEALMRSDTLPEINLREAESRAKFVKASAADDAKQIVSNALALADKTVADARNEATAIRTRLLAELRKATVQLS
jgi:hypothetical protein